MAEYRIAAIPGDGIGAEVIAAGLRVFHALEAREPGLKLNVESFPWGSDYYREHACMMAEDGLERLRGFDAIYLAPSATPTCPTMSRCGGSGSPSARASSSTPTCARRACCRESRAPWKAVAPISWTG